jgi:RNA polymerase sigma factor (sigma-70 family)
MAADPWEALLARWQQGDQQAAEELFRRYKDRLIALASSRLSSKLSHRVDAEDVVQSAYRSFFRGARNGQYEVQCGDDLWQLLVVITLHKLQFQVRSHQARKRSAERDQHLGTSDNLFGLQASLLARDPSPVEAASLADELEQLMRGLDPLQRRMVELRLQGCDLDEIATATERCQRTVRRTLDEIKQRLQKWQACS